MQMHGNGLDHSDRAGVDDDRPLSSAEMDIFYAAGYGEYERCVELLKAGVSSRSRDHTGNTPLHWAALNNHRAIAELLFQWGAQVDTPSEDAEGQTPLHWACIRGHFAMVKFLIEQGASVHKADNRGYTALTHAVQYGQVKVAAVLCDSGADLEAMDSQGHAPLHWAAYQGHANVVQWLLAKPIDLNKADHTKCTALHYAACRGHFHAAVLLVQSGAALDIEDDQKRKAEDLAEEKGFLPIARYLRLQRRRRWVCPSPHSKTRFFALIFLVLSVFDVLCYIIYVMPLTAQYTTATIVFFVGVPTMFYFYYKAARTDPGFVTPSSASEQHRSPTQVDGGAENGQGRGGDLEMGTEREVDGEASESTLCHTCNVRRPLRSKHCRICKRCVARFDHHCTWLNACVGRDNHKFFYIYVLLLWAMMSILLVFDILAIGAHKHYPESWSFISFLAHLFSDQPLLTICFLYTLLIWTGVSGLSIVQSIQIGRNITTNESFNWRRYTYLTNEYDEFHNPFDGGVLHNFLVMFGVRDDLSLSERALSLMRHRQMSLMGDDETEPVLGPRYPFPLS